MKKIGMIFAFLIGMFATNLAFADSTCPFQDQSGRFDNTNKTSVDQTQAQVNSGTPQLGNISQGTR